MECLTINLAARFSYRKDLVKAEHVHDADYQIQVVTSGGATVMIDGGSFPLKEGSLLLVKQGSTHSFKVGPEGMKTREVKFSTSDGEYKSILSKLPLVSPLEGQQLVKLMDRIIDEWFIRQSGYQILSSCLLSEALVFLDRSSGGRSGGVRLPEVLLDADAPPPIKAINEFVSRHIDHKFSLAELAEGSGYNQDYLYRVVAREFGIPLVKYVNNLRLESAKQYLLHSELSVTEIAWNLGFDTIQSFSKFFHHGYGESPSQFLKRIQEQHHNDHT